MFKLALPSRCIYLVRSLEILKTTASVQSSKLTSPDLLLSLSNLCSLILYHIYSTCPKPIVITSRAQGDVMWRLPECGHLLHVEWFLPQLGLAQLRVVFTMQLSGLLLFLFLAILDFYQKSVITGMFTSVC